MKHLAIAMSAVLALLNAEAASAQALTLREGTAIRLETRQDISSKSAKVGDSVELAVAAPLVVDGTTLIPAGAPAVGEVSRVRDNGLLGRSGKLDIKVTKIRAGETEIPVRGQRNSKGKSGTLGAVGAGVVFLPLAIIVKGLEAKIKAGTAFDVYVDRDVALGEPAAPEPPYRSEPPQPLRSIDPSAPTS